MSRTPEKIICKVRKFCHDALLGAGHISLLAALIAWLVGGPWLLFVIGGVVAYGFASNITYEWEKVFEQGVFRPKR